MRLSRAKEFLDTFSHFDTIPDPYTSCDGMQYSMHREGKKGWDR